MVRRNKGYVKRFRTTIQRNESIQGDSIEAMLERLKAGEGIEGIEDRDLVYNDSEASRVNPVTNIRSDKMELMLDEKIAQQEHKRKKMRVVDEKEKLDKESTEKNEGTDKESGESEAK